jgi:type III restriction enzyme
MQTDQAILPFRAPVEERLLIRGMLFGGFAKCLYPAQKFDSDPERRFTVILEDDTSVLKWLRPPKNVLKIYYRQEDVYQPDFVVETETARYLCEPKRASEMTDEIVQHKAKAATLWCQHASGVSDKPWHYVLIPHDTIEHNTTFRNLIKRFAR